MALKFLTNAFKSLEHKIVDPIVNKTIDKVNITADQKVQVKQDFAAKTDPLFEKTAKAGTAYVAIAAALAGGIVLAPVLGPLAAGGGAAAAGGGAAAAGGGAAAAGGGSLAGALGAATAAVGAVGAVVKKPVGAAPAPTPNNLSMSAVGDFLRNPLVQQVGGAVVKSFLPSAAGPLATTPGTVPGGAPVQKSQEAPTKTSDMPKWLMPVGIALAILVLFGSKLKKLFK